MDFAKRLKELRLARGLSQEQLAKELNLVKSSISMYEQGKRKPSFEVLEAIADFFNVNLDTLIDKAPNNIPVLDEPEIRILARNSQLDKDPRNQQMLRDLIKTVLNSKGFSDE